MRIARLLAPCIVTLLALTACHNGDTPVSATEPPSPGTEVLFTAVGTSDVAGYGSSRPCGLFDDCNGNGYVWQAARRLQALGFPAAVTPLGIPGAVVGPAFEVLASQAGRPDVVDSLTLSAMARVRQTATLVTVSTGVNDVNIVLAALDSGLAGQDRDAFVDRQVEAFAREFETLITGVRENAPGARLVVLNLPNVAAFPFLSGASLDQRRAAQRAVTGINRRALNDTTANIRVVDLMCDERFTQPSSFAADGYHWSDAAHGYLAAAIVNALTAAAYPAPRTACPAMTLY